MTIFNAMGCDRVGTTLAIARKMRVLAGRLCTTGSMAFAAQALAV